MISSENIKDFIFRFKKFVDLFVFELLNKKLILKSIIRKFGFYFKTLKIGGRAIPWIPIKAKLWLDETLKPNMTLYEYGSGISTLYFSTKVKNIISIEHNKNWYNNIKKEIVKRNINNCEYFLIEPDKVNTKKSNDINTFNRSGLKEYSKFIFDKYVESIDKYPDKFFDLVFIDGRARLGCIQHSINKIKLGGYLVLDNSDENKYKLAQQLLKKHEKRDFFGIAPANPYLKLSKVSYWKASVWKIK